MRNTYLDSRALLVWGMALLAGGCGEDSGSSHTGRSVAQGALALPRPPDNGLSESRCTFLLEDGTLTLTRDCTTDKTILIPDGYTLDGAGHTVSAVDPIGGHFTGPIVRNRGASAHVRNLVLQASNLMDVCDSGPKALRGILFENASGSIVDSQVLALQQASGFSGCQEGFAFEVRNTSSTGTPHVELLRNRLAGYQKAGIVAVGRVDVAISDNELLGGGPTSRIARNGIQLSLGASGKVLNNRVSGHSYAAPGYVASGILVTGGGLHGGELCVDVAIRDNVLAENDVGVYLAQYEADEGAPATATRLRVEGNSLHSSAITNGHVYQAAISDSGTGNVITSNLISGPGHDEATLPGATFAVDVAASPASQLAFLTPSHSPNAGACSGRLTVQTQDDAGNLSRAADPAFFLSASGPAAQGLTFHARPDCSDLLLIPLLLDNPQAEASFFFKALQPGEVVVTVTGSQVAASQAQTVVGP